MNHITLLSDIDLGKIINNIHELKATELSINPNRINNDFFYGLQGELGVGFEVQKITNKIIANRPAYDYRQTPVILLTEKPLDESIILYKSAHIVIISTFSSPSYQDYIIASLLYLACIYLQENIEAYPIKGAIELNIYKFINYIESITIDQKKRNSYTNYLYQIYTYKTNYAKEHSILLTHGIDTHGEWTDQISKKLQLHGFNYRVVGGFVKIIKFVRGRGRYESVEKLLENIIDVQQHNQNKNISIIAHSYGTLVLSKALSLAAKLKVKIKIHNIILTGSIIRSDYNWTQFVYGDLSVKVTKVYNVCGELDPWPIFASRFVYDAGHSGAFFFENSDKQINNLRLHKVSHTNMFTDEIFNQFYLKFLSNDRYTQSREESCAHNHWMDKLFRILRLQ